ncbi:hypothetical protein [Streptomyces sp. NPDC091209]|uniref:hypothetical protein n=1 Tax=Streptomyces sp. NPDC091209 TaxID=3365974 RepID=UPI00380B2D37
MTTHSAQTPLVRLHSDGTVDEETLAYARTKIDVVVGRPGLPVVIGEVHLVRAAAHHAGRPWSATADLRIGGRHVVAAAEEATGTEVVDRLQDRLRRQTDQASQAWDNGHRTTAPPWRGATQRPSSAAGPDRPAEDSPTA